MLSRCEPYKKIRRLSFCPPSFFQDPGFFHFLPGSEFICVNSIAKHKKQLNFFGFIKVHFGKNPECVSQGLEISNCADSFHKQRLTLSHLKL